MNGAQDMGGAHGFGPVKVWPKEAVDGPGQFHYPWEKRALALSLAMGATGQWSIDQSRFKRESLPPAVYLGSSYYKIWTLGLTSLILEKGLLSRQELKAGKALEPARPVARVLKVGDVASVLSKGAPYDRPPIAEAKFGLGQTVKTLAMSPSGHTRLPRYARDKLGVVSKVHGCHVFADASAKGVEQACWLYSIRFDAKALWGDDTTASEVFVDCFEPYLESVA